MDELIRHFKNLEEDEISKQMDEAFNRGWHYAMENPEVKKALERMKPKKPNRTGIYKANCICGKEVIKRVHKICPECGQALDWEE